MRTGPPKQEWANYDVSSPSGIRIEVKSSAYWQSWPQTRPSRIGLLRTAARTWHEDGSCSADREVRADVYVFAVQNCVAREQYDPLDIDQWEFRAIPAGVVRNAGARSFGLAFLDRAGARAVRWAELAQAIELAAVADTSGCADGGSA